MYIYQHFFFARTYGKLREAKARNVKMWRNVSGCFKEKCIKKASQMSGRPIERQAWKD
jgi:hypothetical protein